MRKLTTEEFIEKARQKHGTTYDYSKVVYGNSRTKVEIICNEHGSFFQIPKSHIRNEYACMKCSIIGRSNKRKTSVHDFIEQGNKVYNNRYLYTKVEYVNCDTPVIITCKIHGDFQTIPYNHLKKLGGCKKCRNKKETLCRNAIEKITGKLFPETRPKFLQRLSYDGYNEELKMAFEYMGRQHTEPVEVFGGEDEFKKTQERDAKKIKLSKLNNITLIIVPYTVTNFEKYFEDYFYFM